MSQAHSKRSSVFHNQIRSGTVPSSKCGCTVQFIKNHAELALLGTRNVGFSVAGEERECSLAVWFRVSR